MVGFYCTFYCTYWGIETLDTYGVDNGLFTESFDGIGAGNNFT